MASWVGRGGGRSNSQPSLSIQGGPGRGGGRLRGQVNLNLNSGAGMGSGRPGSQPTLSAAFGYTNGEWVSRGGGRHPFQAPLQPASGHDMQNWQGRGGGRARVQPTLQPASGQDMSDWKGRGGGRNPIQAPIQPATGKNFSNWIGRGGGRSPIQPSIMPASIIAAQRAMLGAASNMVSSTMGSSASMLGMPTFARELEDPMGGYVFALEINGMEVAHFSEIAGMKSNTEVYEIREGGVNHVVHKLPGQSTWDNITLKYGVTSDMSMLALREYILNDEYAGSAASQVDLGQGLSASTSLSSAINSLAAGGDPGKMEQKRFAGSIVVKNNRMQEMVRYTFQQAWVVSWEGPKLNSEGSDLAVERIEIAHHGVSVSRSYVTKVPAGWV
jgi:phage tail-like protein